MLQYLKLFQSLRLSFQKVSVVRVSRSQNSHVNSLATLALSSEESIPRMIFVELLEQLSIERQTMVGVASAKTPSWMDPYITFLSDGSLPTNEKEAEKVRRTSSHFWLFEDKKLYRRSFGGPYLLCLHPSKTIELLAELQEGVCGRHSSGRSLAHRAMTQGFWWLNMQREAAEYVKRCDQCQRNAHILHQLGKNLNLIINPWPFAQ